MSDIVAFLNACLDEDERISGGIREGGYRHSRWESRRDELGSYPGGAEIWSLNWVIGAEDEPAEEWRIGFVTEGRNEDEHIARHDPARVLREVAAKRELLQLAADMRDRAADCEDYVYETYADQIEFAMAKGYADRDGYNPAWRVE